MDAEIGPIPYRDFDKQMRMFRLRKVGCFCAECRAANPLKRAIYEKDVAWLRRNLNRAASDKEAR